MKQTDHIVDTNKKVTAVEWLIEQLTPSISLQQKHIDELKDKAKEMEKEQIKNAIICNQNGLLRRKTVLEAEQYYNETYNK
jgi:3-mercaptopyruvate sulfurtransferase SseA